MNLKELRISKKLNQSDAANICGVPLRTYKRLENEEKYKESHKYDKCFSLLNEYQVVDDNKARYDIAIVGAGYVGYSLGESLSKTNNVILIDINKDRVEEINSRGGVKATLPNIDLYKNKDYIFICVPTNYDETTGLLDIKGVTSVVKDIRSINPKATIVIKSTCYVGFTDSLNDDHIIYCPEFLREKTALYDMKHPSRIVIGSNKKTTIVTRLGKLLQSCAFNRPHVLYMSTKEAEAVKLFSNGYLAMRVAFFNELDTFANNNELDVNNIINGVSLDPRIGDYYNMPSPGYGGKCLPKDTLTLANQTKGELISSIDRSNNIRKANSKNK